MKLGLLFSTPYEILFVSILLISLVILLADFVILSHSDAKLLLCSWMQKYYRNEPYTPVFKLPTAPPELRIQWLNALHRDGTGDLKSIYVCLNHFNTTDIIKVDRVMQADRNLRR